MANLQSRLEPSGGFEKTVTFEVVYKRCGSMCEATKPEGPGGAPGKNRDNVFHYI